MPDGVQRVLALVGAIASAPLVLALGLAVRLETRGPMLFVARRVGEGGRQFRCLKLRTMTWRPEGEDAGVTPAGDARVTRVGRVLRRTRLDELPQLWNIVRGEMRLVGPRPEDPRYVDLSDPLHRLVFTARPGLTGLAQLLHVDEAERIEADDPDRSYVSDVLPAKLRIDAAYLRRRSASLDLWILAQTPRAVLGRPVRLPRDVAGDLGSL